MAGLVGGLFFIFLCVCAFIVIGGIGIVIGYKISNKHKEQEKEERLDKKRDEFIDRQIKAEEDKRS